MKLFTKFTQLLNVASPIISAPMGQLCAKTDLAVAVTNGGGFGMIGAAMADAGILVSSLRDARARLRIPAGKPLPLGVGFIGWLLDQSEVSPEPQLNVTLAEMPKVIWLSFGVDLGKYVARIRDYDAKRAHKTLVFVIVNSVEDAVRATNVWKVDGLVVQGIEAGGHGSSEAPPLFILLQAVLKTIPKSGPLIIAAGGAATGAQVAALLTMGADAVAMGTRFLTTDECAYTPAFKSLVLAAGFNDTLRSVAWDEAARTNFWPTNPQIDARALRNKVIDDYNEGLSLEERRRRFDASAAAGATDRLYVLAGQVVGLVNDRRKAAELVQSITQDTIATLKSAKSLLKN